LKTKPKENISSHSKEMRNFILFLLFVTGLILTVFEINIFRKTVIDWKIPTGIWLFTGFVSLFWLRKYLIECWDTKSLFWHLFFCVVSFGGFFVYGFMAINYYLPNKNKVKIIKATIHETGHLAKGKFGCGNPYAYVYIKGELKELIFPCGFKIDNNQFVSVKLQRGLLGFDIIVEQIPETTTLLE
jgi:hypothetical protein